MIATSIYSTFIGNLTNLDFPPDSPNTTIQDATKCFWDAPRTLLKKYLLPLLSLLLLASLAGGVVAAPVNLALNKLAVASSLEKPTLPAAAAFDGNATTRWSSAFSDPQWIYVDLGANYTVNRVKLTWERAYAKAFKIQASNDAVTWVDIYGTTTGLGGIQDLTVTPTAARYIRMYGSVRKTIYGYSLFEMEVYGAATGLAPTLSSIAVTPANPTIQVDVTQQFAATGTNSDGTTQNLTSQVTWASTSPVVATISANSGLATGVGVGASTISATLGSVVSPPQTLQVTSGGGTVNLALNKPVVASSIEKSTLPAAAAFDGNATTRWSSAFSDPQWIYVDLGANYTVNRVKLTWERAYAKAFKIQASNDAVTWVDIYGTTTGLGGIQDLTVTPTAARYIRMYSTVRAFTFGYSLFEMEVYGTATVPAPTLSSLAVTPANPTIQVGAAQQFAATGTYSDGTTQNLTSQVTWASTKPAVATISANSGLATGAGVGTSTISATLGGVVSLPQTLQVATVPLALTVNTTVLPGGSLAVPYSATVTAKGGTLQYSWSIVSGTLPAGLVLNPGTGAISGTPTASDTFNFGIKVTDSASPAGTSTQALSITVTVPTNLTIWPGTTLPKVVDDPDSSSVELGVKFKADTNGSITGIRFYKASTNGGAHVGNLWSSTGTKLASATFSGETASGWQQVNFSTPVAITKNTVYVASYYAPSGHYSTDSGYFASTGYDNPPLHALANNAVSGANGVYAYGATSVFPTQTFNFSNYWVDVVFIPLVSGPPPTLTKISVTPANPTLQVGATQQFTATGTYSDGTTQILTSQVTWASTSPAIATIIANSGLATGFGVGTSTLSATLGGIVSTPQTLQVIPALASIAVTPTNPTLQQVGATLQFTATGTYSDGTTQDLTSQVTWASTSPALATVIANSGLVTAGVGIGTSTISATLGGVVSTPQTLQVTSGVGTVNLALNKPAVASSTEKLTLPAAAAFDGNTTTRWSSAFSDPQWIYVDLGANYTVNRVKLIWEAAYAKAFKIQASNDAVTWVDIYGTATGSGNIQNLTVTQTTARYIRMYGTVRATIYGYSLFEMEVYGPAPTLSSIAVTPTNPTIQVGATRPFTATGTYSDGTAQNITNQVTWASTSLAVATISANSGLATGVGVGTSTISASQGSGVVGSIPLTVQVTGAGGTVSITNPGSQSTDVSAIVNLPVQAQDSVSNPLSYSSTGLPPGFSINPSTGKITGSATNQAGIYQATVQASSKGGTNSASFTWTVTIPASPVVDILMSGYDPSGTAANLAEIKLNAANVNGQQFGRLFSLPVYGKIYAQPLYVSNVTIPGQGIHNVLYVATMEDMLYAFDAQNGTLLWSRKDLVPAGATPFPVTDAAYTNSLNIAGDVGIESTPVIDRLTKTLYLVQRTKENGKSVSRLRAVDITTGNDKLVAGGVTIAASYSVGGNTLTFDPRIQMQRPGLTIARGQVIIGFGSHEDVNHYHGWIMAYDMSTLQQTGSLVVSPSSYGGAVWMAGRAPVVDSNGYAYLFTSNSFGSPGWNPAANNFDRGESVLKLDPLQGINVIDWFTPSNWQTLDALDKDLGGSGPILIPGTNFLFGGGKDGNLFLLAKDSLAGSPLQTIPLNGTLFNGPAMWRRTPANGGSLIYVARSKDLVRSFPFDGASIQSQYAQAVDAVFASPGANLAVSADGETPGSGIVWAYGGNLGSIHKVVPGELRAYAADTLTLLWKSTTNFARDDLGSYGKFTIPVVANGQVFVATQSNQVVVYGQLPGSADFTLTALPSYAPTLAGTATFNLNANPINGFGGPVTWSVSGPSGVTATFCSTNTNPCTGNTSNTGNQLWATVTATAQAPLGQNLLTVTATSGPLPPHTQQVVLDVTNTQNVAGPWSIYSFDSQDINGLASNAIDQLNTTFWLTDITSALVPVQPHEIIIDLGQDNIPLKAIAILPRQDGCSTGSPQQFQIYVAPTLTSAWSTVDAIGDSFDYSNMSWGCNLVQPRQQQFMFLPNTSARLVKFRSLSEVNNGKATSAAEIKLFK